MVTFGAIEVALPLTLELDAAGAAADVDPCAVTEVATTADEACRGIQVAVMSGRRAKSDAAVFIFTGVQSRMK